MAAVIAAFTVIGMLTAAVLVPARLGIDVEDGELVVRLRGWDVFWCLRASVTVPLRAVRAVRAADRSELPRPGRQLPGVSVPGLITAGSSGVGDDRTFWDVRRAHRVLEVACLPGAGYRALILELPDPDGVAHRLQSMLTGGTR